MKIAVLLGGTSSEHDISLQTGSFMIETLRAGPHQVTPVLIDRSGEWLTAGKNAILPDFAEQQQAEKHWFVDQFCRINGHSLQRNIHIGSLSADIVCLGLHGGEGENGSIQGALQVHGLPYTGSGVLASALAMDKQRANLLFQAGGFSVADFYCFERHNFSQEQFQQCQNLTFPVFIKPTEGGSSVHTTMAEDYQQALTTIRQNIQLEAKWMVQSLLRGREVSCGVLEQDNGCCTALPVTEIIPKKEFFDFEAKYVAGQTEEITPANLAEPVYQSVQQLAIKAHTLLGCNGYSRTDFIIVGEQPYILETNTLPGMTATSLVPQQAQHYGLSMSQVLEKIIAAGLQRRL